MSHRLSQAARHTQELLQDLERDKELDVIRVYLTRLNLFPRQRDPKTAPIRSEELRDLAKHWKLHRQRNFWKNHTTKEDLVRTLYKHINTKVLPNEKNPLPLQPEPPLTPTPPLMAPVAPSPTRPYSAGTTESPVKRRVSRFNTMPDARGGRVDQALDPYGGDLFGQRGDYNSGMIYVSRLAKPEKPLAVEAELQNLLDQNKPATLAPEMETLDEDAAQREKRLMAECACSLYQLTLEPGHENSIVLEGCIPAIVQLCNYDDLDVKKFCSATIVNVSVDPSLCPRMIEEGVLAGLMELAKVQQEDIRRNAAIGICRISYERQGQHRLIQEGSVPALISMLNNTDFETKEACVKTLVNIASFSGGNVSESVISTVIRIAAKKDAAYDRFIIETICNLSLLTGSRMKAPDDGILDPIPLITQSCHDPRVQTMIAMALSNFSGIDTNHHLLTTPSLLLALDTLLALDDDAIIEMATTAIANLSTTRDAIVMLAESPLPPRLIATGYNPKRAIQENVSLAIANMALSDEAHRLLLMRHGLVPLLMQLFTESSIPTQYNAMVALCTLMEHAPSRAEIISRDVLHYVIALATTGEPKLRELCAIGLFNFSCYEDFAQYALLPTILDPMITLFTSSNLAVAPKEEKDPTIALSFIQEQCLHFFYNLSFYPSSRLVLVQATCVAACVAVFRKVAKTPELNTRVAATIANLSFCADAHAQMLQDDVLKLLRRLSASSAATKDLQLASATALCNLAIPGLIHSGQAILNLLIDLSHTPHADIALVCSLAYSKVAADASLRDALAKCVELPPTLVVMMRSGIEEIQIHCAAALCGMACERGAKTNKHMWKEGTVSDFIVNSLLRINSDSTKVVCAKVLFNVLAHDDCRLAMIKDGVLYALIKLARLESVEIRILCVTALYNLSSDPSMVPSLMEANVPHVVSKLCDSDFKHEESRRKLSACLTNMALSPGMEIKLMEGGVLNAILALCEHGDSDCLRYGASVLCSVSMQPANCDGLASSAALDVLKRMVCSKDPSMVLFAANALCNVACGSHLHEKIEEAELISAMLHVVSEANEDEGIILTSAKFLCNMTQQAKHRPALMKHHFIRTFIRVFGNRLLYTSVADVCARIVCTLSEAPSLLDAMVGEGAVQLLRMATIDATPTTIEHCVVSLLRLSRGGHSGTRILDDGLFDILCAAVPMGDKKASPEMTERCSMILRTLSTYAMCIPQMIQDKRLHPLIHALAAPGDKETTKNCVMLLHNLTAARDHSFQRNVRVSGVIPLLIRLARLSAHEEVRICAVALAHINCELSEADRNEIEAYEPGVVATMISMLDMDPPAMQRAEKVATTMPLLLHWAPKEKEWAFLQGENDKASHLPQTIPVAWTLRDDPVDAATLVPHEPSSFLSCLPQQHCEFTSTIKDALFGSFQILQVSSQKSRLKAPTRLAHMSVGSVLRAVDIAALAPATELKPKTPTPPPSAETASASRGDGSKEESPRKPSIATTKKLSHRATSKMTKPSSRSIGSMGLSHKNSVTECLPPIL
ncbi:hypothetical protein SDRG_05496 [Saprolegnia diclina VS20]|uniref:Vacuolar protein 8 n=1 Tax=Saprolegnia diclina (strain VS20) TaxID=1156394 RepID=T0S3E8_SAPDV|nr:hypothetical protein SDRG_05496 [Saprolegnia diclina VS20]EQC37272.1 hypothetical protein SDRG_05496 [Saprolegnia diclina VS20]|eukprot:XP_008609434.1 hypothetical protein SDRG_05496 [Saprolegnia diclina VS20]